MSTSLLNHDFGFADQHYPEAEYKEGIVIFRLRTKDSRFRCSCCRSRTVIKRGYLERLSEKVPGGLKPVYMLANLTRKMDWFGFRIST